MSTDSLMPEFEALFSDTVCTWGVGPQVDMVIEELAECVVEIQHYKRDRSTIDKLAEEVADAQIVLAQLAYIIGGGRVAKARAEKLQRLEALLEEHSRRWAQ